MTEKKGNVVVSVRVRPDAGGNGQTTDGEWMVDGRRSLISYNGKEGGDYYYGESNEERVHRTRRLTLNQITFLRPTMTIQKSTIIAPSDWYGELWKDITAQSSRTV